MSGWQKKGGGLKEEEGGILCPNTGPTQHMFIIGIPGQALFSLPDSNLEKKLANYHKILYSDRTQLNYLGGKKVKQNRSESVFNCSWYAVQKQVALLNHLRASTAQGGASLKNNNTL